MSFRVRVAAAAILAAALPLSLAACGGGDGDSDKLTIGTKFDQPGLGLKNPDGTLSGFDVDVATYVAEQLGYTPDQIEWKESPSGQRETLIQNGQVDYIVATYSITDARKEKVDFAGPYLITGQSLLVRADNADITGAESLENNKKLCSVTGSTPAQRIKDKYPGVQLQQYDTYSACVEALKTGAIDAVTTDDAILKGYAAQNPEGPASVSGMAHDPVAVAASNNPLLTTLTAALSGQLNPEVNLVDTLNGAPALTVFAPTDEAFAKVDPATIEALKTDADLLTSVLTYHVVEGQAAPAQAVGTHTTLQGADLAVTDDMGVLKVNDANVVCGGVQTANATVYLIDSVLLPPA